MTETIWLTKPKILTILPLTESLPNPGVWDWLTLELCSGQLTSPNIQPWPEISWLLVGFHLVHLLLRPTSYHSAPVICLLAGQGFHTHCWDCREVSYQVIRHQVPFYHSGCFSNTLPTKKFSLTNHLELWLLFVPPFIVNLKWPVCAFIHTLISTIPTRIQAWVLSLLYLQALSHRKSSENIPQMTLRTNSR